MKTRIHGVMGFLGLVIITTFLETVLFTDNHQSLVK